MRCTLEYVFLTSLLLLLRIRRGCAAVEDSNEFRNKVPVKLVWATPGDDVELPCDITPPTPNDTLSMVLWFKDEAGIPLYSLDARTDDLNSAIHGAVSDDLGKRTYFQIADGHRAQLKVTKVSMKDQGVFRCRVDFVNSPTRNFRVNLTLVEEPTKPVIYDAQGREVLGVGGPFLEGYDLLLTCQVSGGRPKPTVTWWKDGELLDGVVDTAVIGSSSRFTINHLFIGKITRSLWGSKLECRAQSGPMEKPIVREISLDIYLKPAVVKIVFSQDQIYAGRRIGVKCETWGSSPAARIVWRLGGHVITDPNVSTTQRSNSTVSKLALVLGKDDDGKELTCRAENPRFPGGVLEETKILRVAYPPIVNAHLAHGYILDSLREGDDLKLVCNVQSNPPPTRVVWYHDDKQLEHDVTAGILVAFNTLTIRVLTLAHAGDYSCEAVNLVGESHSIPLGIHMKYAPRCGRGHERQDIVIGRHETVALRCEVDAQPDDAVRFSWTYNSTRGDILPIANSRAQNRGLASIMDYTPTTEEDFGTLACWASNSVGRQEIPCIFNVLPAKAPQKPSDCRLRNESNALEVNCIPGSDGGSPQHFLLEVRGIQQGTDSHRALSQTLQTLQSDQGEVGVVPPLYQESNTRPNFQLHGLEPDIDYTIYIYAVNGRGKSEPVLLKHVIVVEPIGRNMQSSGIFLEDLRKAIPVASPETIMIFAVTGIALMLVGVGIIIGVVLCRKRSNAPVRESPDDFTTPTYIPAQRIEPRIRYGADARRSQRTSLFLDENRNDPDILQQIEIDMST